jgi:hypothetical protein
MKELIIQEVAILFVSSAANFENLAHDHILVLCFNNPLLYMINFS